MTHEMRIHAQMIDEHQTTQNSIIKISKDLTILFPSSIRHTLGRMTLFSTANAPHVSGKFVSIMLFLCMPYLYIRIETVLPIYLLLMRTRM